MASHEPPAASTPLEELTETECLELLATKRLGRIAWCGGQGPRVPTWAPGDSQPNDSHPSNTDHWTPPARRTMRREILS
jgi:hypothetical protein